MRQMVRAILADLAPGVSAFDGRVGAAHFVLAIGVS